ncbi:MAG TPA: [acyl-carrier-protein] S-malonyltransferase [Geobacter sp.]|nr:[acyl-carrier-protein] S-malonyltransferase [Geobacter sp.]
MQSYAFIFPGQGSQHAGMGKDLADNFKTARISFEEADDALGFSLSRLCFEGPEEDLKLTANTQPAILAASVAALRVLREESPLTPSFLAGHSLGEYSALVASGALQFADALRIVRARGSYMQDAVPVGVGAMAAILGAEADVLQGICEEAAQGQIVSPANFNSPGQIVIAGHTAAVNRAIEIAKGKGLRKAMLLPVSAPFHCALMQKAAQRLSETLDPIQVGPLATPVVTNVEAKPNSDAARVKPLLVEQVCSPVLWDATVQQIVAAGVTGFVEIGPGKVLAGLVKRIDKETTCFNVQDMAGVKALTGGAQ